MNRDNSFKPHRRKGIVLLRPYIPGEDLSNISVSKEDTPKLGDMIAMNPKNDKDQWLIAEQFYKDNYEPTE